VVTVTYIVQNSKTTKLQHRVNKLKTTLLLTVGRPRKKHFGENYALAQQQLLRATVKRDISLWKSELRK
jgi:hypothetical protein